MKRLLLLVLACLLCGSASFAQQNAADTPASKEDIERYLDAMHTRELMKGMKATMTTQMHKMIHEQVLKQPNLPPDFEARINTMTDEMWNDFPVDELIDAMAPVYQKHLTKGDVDALVVFYSSPTGQKVLKEMPAMMAEALQAASGIIQKMTAKAMQRVDEEIAQAQKADDPNSPKKPQQN